MALPSRRLDSAAPHHVRSGPACHGTVQQQAPGGLKFPLAIFDTKVDPVSDDARRPSEALKKFFANGPPLYMFVGPDDTIRAVQLGHHDNLEARFAQIIEDLLAK